MNFSKVLALCVMILSLNSSFAGAAHVLKAVPKKVELGTFNTFQIKETIVKLSNTGKKTFLIDKIKADCACIRTSISTKEIPPGETVELKIAARERTGGKFSHDLLIIPADRESYEPLKIRATGTVIQPISAEIGWEGMKITMFDPNGPVNLGVVHYLSAKPVIHIIADSNHFNMRDAVPDVNSAIFELHSHKFEKFPAPEQIQTEGRQEESLTLLLKPKKKLKTGSLREVIRIKLADDVGLEIPISCLIVGDVYAKEKIIHFGNLSDSTPKKFTIYFTNNAEIWPEVKWNVSGYLSDAVVITEDKSGRTDSRIVLTLAIDQSKLNSLPKGYVFCRISFFQKQPTGDDVISILVDGFNEKQN